jgi:hypothetical protein
MSALPPTERAQGREPPRSWDLDLDALLLEVALALGNRERQVIEEVLASDRDGDFFFSAPAPGRRRRRQPDDRQRGHDRWMIRFISSSFVWMPRTPATLADNETLSPIFSPRMRSSPRPGSGSRRRTGAPRSALLGKRDPETDACVRTVPAPR